MKKILIALFAIFIASYTFAQIPVGYYNNASNKTGATLKTALYNIIKGHTDKGYDGLYTCYKTTDTKANNVVWDVYSDVPGGTPQYIYNHGQKQCGGSYNSEGDCYNREHTFCDSWLGKASPQRSDLFHVIPTDGYVNNRRSSYPHGQVGSASWTSTNGSKLGNSSYPGYTGKVFEPIDEYKGDFARMYFYVATRYEDKIAGWQNNGSADAILAGNSYPCYDAWFLNLMLQWHRQDPVSQKEIDRNNAVYGYQHNRNPYIDHPEYVDLVWDPTNSINSVQDITAKINVFPIPSNGELTITLNNDKNIDVANIEIFNMQGQMVYNTSISVNSPSINETINWNEAENGIYIVKIFSKDFVANKRIVIAK